MEAQCPRSNTSAATAGAPASTSGATTPAAKSAAPASSPPPTGEPPRSRRSRTRRPPRHRGRPASPRRHLAAHVDRWLAECATRLPTHHRGLPHPVRQGRRPVRRLAASTPSTPTTCAPGTPDSYTAASPHPSNTSTSCSHHLPPGRRRRPDRQAAHVRDPPAPRPRRKFNLPPTRRSARRSAPPTLTWPSGRHSRRAGSDAEVTCATWGDITGRELHVRGTKTDESDRYIALSDRTMRALAVHPPPASRQRPPPWLAHPAPQPGPTDPRQHRDRPDRPHPYDPGWVTCTWRAITTRPGSPVHDMHFHDLRHWAASRLFAKGVALTRSPSSSGTPRCRPPSTCTARCSTAAPNAEPAPNCSADHQDA